MEALAVTIANRLRNAREGAGLKQEDVAQALRLSPVGYDHFERGDRLIGVEYLVRLAKLYGKPVAWFLGMPSIEGLTAEEDDIVHEYRKMPEQYRRLFHATVRMLVEELHRF